MTSTDVLGRAESRPSCPLEDPHFWVSHDVPTPLWDELLARRGPAIVAACDAVVDAMAAGLRLAEADAVVARAELVVAESFHARVQAELAAHEENLAAHNLTRPPPL